MHTMHTAVAHDLAHAAQREEQAPVTPSNFQRGRSARVLARSVVADVLSTHADGSLGAHCWAAGDNSSPLIKGSSVRTWALLP